MSWAHLLDLFTHTLPCCFSILFARAFGIRKWLVILMYRYTCGRVHFECWVKRVPPENLKGAPSSFIFSIGPMSSFLIGFIFSFGPQRFWFFVVIVYFSRFIFSLGPGPFWFSDSRLGPGCKLSGCLCNTYPVLMRIYFLFSALARVLFSALARVLFSALAFWPRLLFSANAPPEVNLW